MALGPPEDPVSTSAGLVPLFVARWRGCAWSPPALAGVGSHTGGVSLCSHSEVRAFQLRQSCTEAGGGARMFTSLVIYFGLLAKLQTTSHV